MESKGEIRKRVLAMRDALTNENRMQSEIMLTQAILCHPWFYDAKALLIYMKHGSEIDTGQIIEDAFHLQKRVYIPKIIDNRMEFIRISQGEKLIEGYKGIWEPDIKNSIEIFHFSNENPKEVLMIMPGVAFDSFRNRIGYGKGFYDRYLSDKKNLHTIAIGFDCQLVSVIESTTNDIKPDEVICL